MQDYIPGGPKRAILREMPWVTERAPAFEIPKMN